jgi:hypothetical protein
VGAGALDHADAPVRKPEAPCRAPGDRGFEYAQNGTGIMRILKTVRPHARCIKILTQIPRLTIRKGLKQKGKLQDLYEKDFVFVDPGSLGANLKELMEEYDQIFGARSGK